MNRKTILLSLIISLSLFYLSCSSNGYKVNIDKNEYSPGETINIDYIANPSWDKSAWIGIIPSNIAHGKEAENDNNDIYYQYLEKTGSGTLTFPAPNNPGQYDIRMHDTDDAAIGVEISSVSFTVR